MRVIENDLEWMFVINIHAARCLKKCRVKGSEPVADILEPNIHVVGERSGKHRILHIVNCPAFNRCGNQVCPNQWNMTFLIVNRDHVAIHALFEHEGLPTGTNMLFDQRMPGIHRHIAKRCRIGVVGHLQAMRIVGIKDSCVLGYLYRDTFDFGQLLERIYAL